MDQGPRRIKDLKWRGKNFQKGAKARFCLGIGHALQKRGEGKERNQGGQQSSHESPWGDGLRGKKKARRSRKEVIKMVTGQPDKKDRGETSEFGHLTLKKENIKTFSQTKAKRMRKKLGETLEGGNTGL